MSEVTGDRLFLNYAPATRKALSSKLEVMGGRTVLYAMAAVSESWMQKK